MNRAIYKRVLALALFAAVSASMGAYAEDKGTAVGTMAVEEDKRIPVMLRPNERVRVLEDMRQYLKGLQEMFNALSEDDMARAAVSARKLGKINIYETYLMFPTESAVKFRNLSAGVHADFEGIAEDTERFKDSKNPMETREIMGRLSQTMKKCVTCHESYRLTDSPHSGTKSLGR